MLKEESPRHGELGRGNCRIGGRHADRGLAQRRGPAATCWFTGRPPTRHAAMDTGTELFNAEVLRFLA
jgi:hypothetical protein